MSVPQQFSDASECLAPEPPVLRLVENTTEVIPAFRTHYQHQKKKLPPPKKKRKRRSRKAPLPIIKVKVQQLALDLPYHHPVKGKTITSRRLSRAEKKEQKRLVRLPLHQRPVTRDDCVDSVRPCPYVGCRANLFLDVNEDTGVIKLNFPGFEPHQMVNSCVLDIIDDHPRGVTLDVIACHMNLTVERVRQIETLARSKVKRRGRRLGAEYMEDDQ